MTKPQTLSELFRSDCASSEFYADRVQLCCIYIYIFISLSGGANSSILFILYFLVWTWRWTTSTGGNSMIAKPKPYTIHKHLSTDTLLGMCRCKQKLIRASAAAQHRRNDKQGICVVRKYDDVLHFPTYIFLENMRLCCAEYYDKYKLWVDGI